MHLLFFVILYFMEYPFTDIHTHCDGSALSLRSYGFTDAGFGSRAGHAPYSVGVHPWHADDSRAGQWIASLYSEPAAAVGEIGLDYVCGVDRSVQREVFERQMDVALALKKPVVLHIVRAFEPVMDILRHYPALPAVVLHGFVGSGQQARRAVERGYFLSVGLRSLASGRTVGALREVGLRHLLLETDDSPVGIESVCERACSVLNVPQDELLRIVYDNFKSVIL